METKKTHKWWTIFEYYKVEDYLREMHKKGWKLVKVKGLTTHVFEKCTPEDVIYRLDFNQEGIKNKEEYIRMFNDCGWEFIQGGSSGFAYFRKPADSPETDEGIFCDDESKLEVMGRIIKGRIFPLGFLFVLALSRFFMTLSWENYYVTAVVSVPVAMCVGLFAYSAYKYYSFKKRIGK